MHMIVPLNLVLTYPVHWDKYNILRDFVQNFYDSVGYREWQNAFHYSYDEAHQSLIMWVDNTTFSYEWLMHIGASTKTSASGSNAGYFGEGFKIASLCAVRDYAWDIRMSSNDWTLDVITIQQEIDKQNVRMLAYDIQESALSSSSILRLSPLLPGDIEIFKTVLLSFYYPENPLLGDVLWEGPEGAAYTRSTYPYPNNLPCTYDFGRKGIVFCAFQVLGSNPFDLVICYHKYRNKDRERKALYSFNVVDVFESVAYYVDAQGAMRILEKMRRNWNSVPSKHIDIDSWYPSISSLVDKVASDSTVNEAFVTKYPNLLYLPALYTNHDKNRRTQARSWLHAQSEHYLLVQKAFKALGYKSLEQACEEGGGFVKDDTPSTRESQCFQVLRSLVDCIFSGFFCFERTPDHRVIRNLTASSHGMASLVRFREKKENSSGIRIRYTIREIYLKENCFRRDGFYNALATYVHECCHMFGGDSSESFSFALTLAMERLIISEPAMASYRSIWEALFDQDTQDSGKAGA